ncbi:hypothetical protein ABWH92_16735 [Ahrensia marina]|uniref:hypothetical protein n=1 Tax=Ahrensia marina TaxID=1514904 RepID=UPI0035D07C73
MGDRSQQRSSRQQRGLNKAVNADARARRATKTASNVVPLPPVDRPSQSPLPKDHQAQIVLFTGVQIVRNGTQG